MEVYILYSKVLEKHYVGFSESAERRLKEHRKEKHHWTARADDWKIVWTQTVHSTAEARLLEKRIKARGAKRFLEDLSKPSNPD